MKIVIVADHTGLKYKTLLIADLQKAGYEVQDFGTHNNAPDDYPDHAADVALAILSKKAAT